MTRFLAGLAAVAMALPLSQARAAEKLPDMKGPDVQQPTTGAVLNPYWRAINQNFLLNDGGNPSLPSARTNLGVGPVLAAKDYGALGNGTADDAAALATGCAAAAAAGSPLGLSGTYKVSSDRTFACDLSFGAGAQLLPDSAKTITHTGRASADDTAWIFGGSGTVTTTSPYRSVMWWGAGKSGSADDAPGFRAALASNTYIKVPAISYTFASTQTAPCCALNDAGLLITGLANFVLDAYGARLAMSNAYAFSSWLHIAGSTNWKLMGLECVGNRTGLTASNENSCFTLTNNVGFVVRDIYASGNWGGLGAISAGDWLVDGLIQNIRGDKIGLCFDYAFLKNVTIRGVKATGADNSGNQGAGQVGSKCFSNIYDGPNSANNTTGVSFTYTDGVVLDDFDASNFDTGWLVTSGQRITLGPGNHWHDNPGHGGSKGIGGLISYANGGSFSSVGFPAGRIKDRSRYSNNGTGTAGAAVYLDPSAIANGDQIVDLDLDIIADNNTSAGVNTTTASHLSGLKITGLFSGANQTTAVATSLAGVSGAVIGGYGVTPQWRLPNASAGVARNAANSADVDLLKLDGSDNLSLLPAGGIIYTSGELRAGGGTAAAANYMSLIPAAAGSTPGLKCLGASTDINCRFESKGVGNHEFYGNGSIIFAVLNDKTLFFYGSSSGNTVLKATAAASGTLTLPAATDTLVGKATTDALTNKTLTAPIITSGTLAGLGACGAGNNGALARVTDATAPTYNAAITGGGAVVTLALCVNGTGWTAH